MDSTREKLNDFYLKEGIHPEYFTCRNRGLCESFAFQGKMIEAKMSMVGRFFGKKLPRIVVVSLDPPNQGEKFLAAARRTTEYVSNFSESENYTINRPNPHWSMTQIIVKEILGYFDYPIDKMAAVVEKSYAGLPIENVSAYFAHVNLAKCSMRNPHSNQAPRVVHNTCSRTYLESELMILSPDVLISQGNGANEILGKLLLNRTFSSKALPVTYESDWFGRHSTLWMPMRHPSRLTGKIRKDWPTYKHVLVSFKSGT